MQALQYQSVQEQALINEKQEELDAQAATLTKLSEEIEEVKDSKKNLNQRMKKKLAESSATILGLEDKANQTRIELVNLTEQVQEKDEELKQQADKYDALNKKYLKTIEEAQQLAEDMEKQYEKSNSELKNSIKLRTSTQQSI